LIVLAAEKPLEQEESMPSTESTVKTEEISQ